MKTPALIGIFISLTVFAPSVKADVLCGNVQRRIIRPVCQPDEMCAQYFRVAHILVNPENAPENEIELQTRDRNVLDQIVASENHPVCVTGEQPAQAQYFEVTAVEPAN